ncbi:Avirulence (Avh) protein [Phytophthora megakarya]|uniref:Avirulence (Avh) protein n=1 Tax=Phytophthora megakarya TaxID=4795 RepID=A0A225WMZ1_9STRA|nr:Avirulence (Avh) protein [Phytophthora megakarya]
MRSFFAKLKYRSWIKQGKTPKSVYKTARSSGLGYGHYDWAVAAGYSKFWYHQLKYGPFAVDETTKRKKKEH